VTELEHVVQQNAVMAEETAAATSSLNEQASKLVSLTASFKLSS
jgi:methyl-accepting chemotaxis protein